MSSYSSFCSNIGLTLSTSSNLKENYPSSSLYVHDWTGNQNCTSYYCISSKIIFFRQWVKVIQDRHMSGTFRCLITDMFFGYATFVGHPSMVICNMFLNRLSLTVTCHLNTIQREKSTASVFFFRSSQFYQTRVDSDKHNKLKHCKHSWTVQWVKNQAVFAISQIRK